jgi:KipI family sensor histidine kinase inhibitor
MLLRRAGDAAIIAEFSEALDPRAAARARALDAALVAAAPAGLVETMPSLRSLLVRFDPLRISGRAICALLTELGRDLPAAPATAPRRFTIPVCYDAPFTLDLDEAAIRLGLPAEEVIARHCAPTYTVIMVGSFPGHPYLIGLDPALFLPRRVPPRTRLPAGSVGMAEAMANIYPQETPGGWNILGRTPLRLFDPAWEQPALLAPGDEVRFTRIAAADFA